MIHSRTKSFIFYLVAILLPVALLVLAEMSLRAVDYGKEYPLFVDVPAKPGYLQPNDQVIKRFFPLPEMAPTVSPDTQFFLKQKPADSFRIVVQGGSTAAGFPFGRWGSLSSMLQQRFKRLYPDKHIEVINTAMASVNTYTLMDFVDEIVEIEPDLVVIYAGHNEYLGVMGVGSAFAAKGGRAATLLHLRFKDIKLYQWIQSTYYKLFGPEPQAVNDRTLMAKIAREKDIPLGSELYQQGVEQFSGNLSFILSEYQKSSVPVLLGNLVSNEKDQIPFSSIDSLSSTSQVAWLSMSRIERDNRIAALQTQIQSDNVNLASLHYELGYLHFINKEYDKARQYFIDAKDNDTLRFRAPAAFNQVIEEVAKQHGAILVDVDSRFRQDTKDAIIGKNHMLEHLHPTERGYFLLGDAFTDSILQQGWLGQAENQNEQLAWAELPITKADRFYGEFKVKRLTSDYPFRKKPISVKQPSGNSIEGQAALDRLAGENWLSINQKLSPIYQRNKDLAEAALISGLLSDAIIDNFDLAYVAGLINKRANNIPFAVFYLNRALRLNSQSVNANLSLAQSYFLLGKHQRSLDILNWVKSVKPDHPNIDQLIKTVQSRTN